MKKTIFRGCGTAIATPFDENGINYDAFSKLIENQIKNDIDAIIICGTTGESSTMSMEEKKNVIKFAINKINKRTKAIIGTGSNDTKKAIEMSKYAEEVGADALLVVTPYYNKTTQKGLVSHYKAIADSVSLPIIVYSVPSRTGVNVLPETCLELSKINNIVAIKEASGNISQVAKIASLCGDNLDIYSGNDDQIVPILSLGGKGVISVLSNVMPKYTKDMVYNYFNGKQEEATKMQLNAIELIDMLFCEVNPIPVKHALNVMGYDYGIPRLPLVELSKPNQEKLEKVLKRTLKK